MNNEASLLTLQPLAFRLTVQEKVSNSLSKTTPRVYPLYTLHNRTWPNLAGLLSLYLHTASDHTLEVGTAWEQGYV